MFTYPFGNGIWLSRYEADRGAGNNDNGSCGHAEDLLKAFN